MYFIRNYTRIILAILFGVAGIVTVPAMPAAGKKPMAGAENRDSLVVSLLTCRPGPEVYELCGHEALRVRGDSIDMVWNYGTFDYSQPNFVYRFVKGETDYRLSAYPFIFFLPEYESQGRRVVEQDLNLTQEEARKLLELITLEAQPENCTYRYNYVKDNCSTRILERLDESADSRIIYPDTVRYGTFRNEMRAFHKDYPWYQFGIDLALGSGIDYPLNGREEMFVPIETMRKVADARFEDGRPLVRETRVLNEGVADATLGPTPPYLTPLAVSWTFFAFVLATCLWQWRKNKLARWLYSIWFLLLGLTGCVVTFLVFVSSHEATSPNILLLWLNPLQLVIGIGVWFRKAWRVPTIAMSYVDTIVMAILLIVWPMQTQSANPAFFPLMGATLLLALSYAIIAQKKGYNIDEKIHHPGARSAGGTATGKHRCASRRRTTTSGGRNRG